MGGEINLLNKSTQLYSFTTGMISTPMAVGCSTTSVIPLFLMTTNFACLNYGKNYTEKHLHNKAEVFL